MTSGGNEEWERLGELLIAARVGKGYRRRSVFARDLGLSNDRVLYDLENAKRTNFDRSTLAFVEQAYGWEHGSIRSVLAGGKPTLAGENPQLKREEPPQPVGLGLDAAAAGLTEEEIEPVLAVVRAIKRAKGMET